MYLSSLFSSTLGSSASMNLTELIFFPLRLRTTSNTISAVITTVTRTATMATTAATTMVLEPSRQERI